MESLAMTNQSEQRTMAADLSDFSTLLVPFQVQPQLDSSPVADLAHFTYSFSSSATLSSFLPSTASTTSLPLTPTSSSQVGDIFTPYNLLSFQDGLCPLSEPPTLFSEQSPVTAQSSTPRLSPSRRKSTDLDKNLGFLPEQSTSPSRPSTPAVRLSIQTQTSSSSSFHFGRNKFVARIGNALKFRSRTTEDITPPFKPLNKQASRSTSALSAFDFGFDSNEETLSSHPETDSIHENDTNLDDMGLMRSLTTRVKRTVEGDEQSSLMRGLTLNRKRPETPLQHIQSIKIKGRPRISLPTQLISTTNMASYHAPSVQDMRVLSEQQAAGYASSPLSDTDNNDRPVSRSGSEHSSASSEPSLTDASSVSSRSFQDESVSPTDIGRGATDYFDVKPVDTPATSCEATPCSTPERKSPGLSLSSGAPAIPQRSPSHSKREHVRLARHRSVRSSLHAASLKLETMNEGVVSSQMGPMAPASIILSRPFSAELAQLSEAVEEFASIAATKDEQAEQAAISAAEDEAYLLSKGLARCSVEDYLDVIQPLAIAFAEAIEA